MSYESSMRVNTTSTLPADFECNTKQEEDYFIYFEHTPSMQKMPVNKLELLVSDLLYPPPHMGGRGGILESLCL